MAEEVAHNYIAPYPEDAAPVGKAVVVNLGSSGGVVETHHAKMDTVIEKLWQKDLAFDKKAVAEVKKALTTAKREAARVALLEEELSELVATHPELEVIIKYMLAVIK